MLKLIQIMRKRDELRNALADAIRADDEDRVSVAMDDWMQFVTDTVKAEADGAIEESDRSVLAARGIRQLTAEETKFYESVIASARQAGEQTVITNITSALPQTVIDSVMDDMRAAYPLLDMIDFVNTGAAVKWDLNAQASQAATWDDVNTEITEDLSGALDVVDLTQRKLSAYICIAQDMLEHGPQWVDRYVRAILADALAAGLEVGIVDGNGLKAPIGMTRDFTGALDSTTGYARKSATSVISLDPTTYGGLLAVIAVDGSTGKQRPITRALLLVNPTDYFDKLAPAAVAEGQASDYVGGVLPFQTDIVQSVGVPSGHAVLGIAKKYFLGVGSGTGGKLEKSDENKFAEDVRTYKVKFYGTGRPYDINAFLYLDISNLVPVIPQIVDTNPPMPETTITGIPPISFKSDGSALTAWSISGDMAQNGTPTPDAPIMPQECGNLVESGEHAGEYAVPIIVGGQTQTVYLSEPLRKIGDYADTVSSDGTVTRRIYKQAITALANTDNFNGGYTIYPDATIGFNTVLSNIAISTSSLPQASERAGKVFSNTARSRLGFGSQPEFPIANPNSSPTTAEKNAFTAYLSTHEVYIWYVLQTPTTEQITAPTLTPEKGSNTLSIGTTMQPSEVSITGHIKQA